MHNLRNTKNLLVFAYVGLACLMLLLMFSGETLAVFILMLCIIAVMATIAVEIEEINDKICKP